jgi:hypothetical protein
MTVTVWDPFLAWNVTSSRMRTTDLRQRIHHCLCCFHEASRQSANQSKQGELSSFDVPISRHEFHWSRFHPFPRVWNLVKPSIPPFVLFSNKEETMVHNFLRFLKIGPFSSSYTSPPPPSIYSTKENHREARYRVVPFTRNNAGRMEAAQFSRTRRFRIRNDSVVFPVLHIDYCRITAWWTPISRVLHSSIATPAPMLPLRAMGNFHLRSDYFLQSFHHHRTIQYNTVQYSTIHTISMTSVYRKLRPTNICKDIYIYILQDRPRDMFVPFKGNLVQLFDSRWCSCP